MNNGSPSGHLEGNVRVYSNAGNPPLVDLVANDCKRLLDVGCGAGDNAALIRRKIPQCEVIGITISEAESGLAKRHMSQCWVADIENEIPESLARDSFDALMFSHVLEHLRDPAAVLSRFLGLLSSGGQLVIAVPNVLSWRTRLQFLLGRFEYQSGGVLDDTHLRFFTYLTADRSLLSKAPQLRLVQKSASGSIPLWFFRRHLISDSTRVYLDKLGCRCWPNLFGEQILLVANKV